MRVEQIAVFLENRAGRLAEVTEILSEAGINIRALSLADTSDFGVLRMIVDDNESACKVLRDRGLTVAMTNVVAVEVPDQPGGLHRILAMMGQAGINVEYMYAFVTRPGDNAIMIFRFSDTDRALALLRETGQKLADSQALRLI